jgi:putative hydrolase of the HAD superfamily
MTTPDFIYFDLGNVLLYFDHEVGCRQMAETARLTIDRVRRALFDEGLLEAVETGRLSRQQAFDAFCRTTGTCADAAHLERAGSDIFRLNVSILPVVAKLRDAGYRLGVLSNTCESHWRFVLANFKAMFPHTFEALALSFKLGACKPDERIYRGAVELAGVSPQRIFYCDDIPANVEAARRVGIDAVQYTDTPSLVADLRKRGVRFNY